MILTSVLTLIKDGLVILLGCGVIASTLLSFYLLLLAVASLRRPREARSLRPSPSFLRGLRTHRAGSGPSSNDRGASKGTPATRFAILIPAHEEELVIGRLLLSIYDLDYPRDLFRVHVIADHCSDRTVTIARSLGATVHERSGPDPQGKSRSLNWLVQHLLTCKTGDALDAFVVLDADSIVSPYFLRAMDLRLRSGNPLVQGLIQIDDPGTDRIGRLRAVAYEFISHLRPLGRSALGLSVGLRGNGMCIARRCAAQFAWDSDSLAEDYELHGRLLAAGLRVAFAPDAIVRTQMPQSLDAARTQSERWERGRLDAMRRHVSSLLGHGLRRLSWASIDGAVELLIPPFSILIVLTIALLWLSLLSDIVPLIVVAIMGLVAQCLYTLRGLVLASARYPHIYRSLLVAPAFVLWRLGLYLGVLARRERVQWTPTARTPTKGRSMSRICIIRHYYYPEDPRGRREAEALADAGHHVDILALRHPGEPVSEVINGVHVRRLPVKHYRGSVFHYVYEYSAFFVLAFAILTARFVRRRYDVVQVNSLPDFLVFSAAACKLFGARLVLDMHECTPELFCTKYRVSPQHPVVRLLGWVEQRCLAFADQVITCTPQQRDVFASRGTPWEKIAVVLNAANSAIFRPRTSEPVLWHQGGRFELVAHGLVAQRYGLDTMVRAVALLKCEIPGVVLHVYGKGDYLPVMEALAQQLGVADRVIAHGFVPEEELLDGIARAHVGVIAAKRDSFRDLTHTQKMYEYVAMHKPVVIAETSAVRTHFDDSCFQFFASDDPTDLASALLNLYHNPARAAAMVRSASRRYRAYSWDAQRHVYCDTALGVARQDTRGRVPSQERVADMRLADLVPVAVKAISTPPSIYLGGLVMPVEDGSSYLSGVAMPVEDGGM
jgi:cellulose synthase/poly-beta-1,6-N-acetylglucosamine synthase-like glycosyltransferase